MGRAAPLEKVRGDQRWRRKKGDDLGKCRERGEGAGLCGVEDGGGGGARV